MIDQADPSAGVTIPASRREFLATAARGACLLCAAEGIFAAVSRGGTSFPGARNAFAQDPAPPVGSTKAGQASGPFIAEARHWETLPTGEIQCHLCPNECEVKPGERGTCRVRENQNGDYKTLVYGRVASLNVDPIEKKPLFHFLPGKTALSLATAGCNINCQFCQNWQISQSLPEDLEAALVSPERMAALAHNKHIPVIAYTYSEPVISFENMIDTARAARPLGVRSVMISNGYIQAKPMLELCEALDAIKIDFKGFNPTFYRDTCRGELKPVLETLQLVRRKGKWLEIVCLIIPTLNDSPAECKRMCRWIVENLGPDVPVHFTRFHPNYKLENLPPTPTKTLERNREIARKAGIRFPYVGNVPGHKFENTFCPECETMIISRYGFVAKSTLEDGACPHCSTKIPGVWS